MTAHVTIARPYARAVFDLAKQSESHVIAWDQVLQVLAIAVREPLVTKYIFNPHLSADRVFSILSALLTSAAAQSLEQIGASRVEHLIRLLMAYRRLLIVPDLLSLYRDLVAQQKNILAVTVSSVYPLEPEVQQSLEVALERRFGSRIAFTFCIDPSLLGGVLIRANNWVIDGSVKTKLSRLSRFLNS